MSPFAGLASTVHIVAGKQRGFAARYNSTTGKSAQS